MKKIMIEEKIVDKNKQRNEIIEFSKVCESYYNGELSIPQYKSLSGGFGTYSERGHKTGMLRLRIPAGDLSVSKLKFILDEIEKYNIERLHITTNQSIQLHHLAPSVITDVMLEAFDFGITTRGGGGDNPRNVLCSPLSGVEKGEYFDVMPYAKAVSDYLTGLIGTIKLPRKLKVAFSNSIENIPHATYRDMGFVANANHRFDLYTAGGLGVNPEMGIKTAENIDPNDILYYIQTMVQVFMKYGNYENRAKARTRYIPRTIGVDKYLSEFNLILNELKNTEDLTLNVQSAEISKKGNGSIAKSDKNIIEQKQAGLYAVKYHPMLGNPSFDILKKLCDYLSNIDDTTLRLSTKEELYIINLTGDEADKVLEIISPDNANTKLQESVSCVGATICQQGIADSSELLQKIIQVDKEENFSDGTLPRICVSGCQSSCSAHQTSIFGLKGGKKKFDGELVDTFEISFGGREIQNNEVFGEVIGTVPAFKIPEMFRKLGKEIEATGKNFEDWLSLNQARFLEIVKEYVI